DRFELTCWRRHFQNPRKSKRSESGGRVKNSHSLGISPLLSDLQSLGSTTERRRKIVMNLFRLRNGNSTSQRSYVRTLLYAALILACFAPSSATQAGPQPQPPGTQNVNVVNTPNVNVANTTASPVPVRDVDNPTREPFQA